VGLRRLSDFPREVGLLSGPIPKSAPEPMNCGVDRNPPRTATMNQINNSGAALFRMVRVSWPQRITWSRVRYDSVSDW
jgi:hypothetical protein